MTDQGKWGPGLLGGVFIGLITGIPVLNFINCACCAGVIGGGVLAVYLYRKQQPDDQIVSMGDGAVLGLMAGVIGSVIAIILTSIFGTISADMLEFASEYIQDMDLDDIMEEFGSKAFQGGFMAISFVTSLIVNTIFGLVGGLLGTAFFGKAKMV